MNKKFLLYIAFATALLATLGSLFFQFVMGLPPCILCWFQRICMYPLIVIFSVGMLREDKEVHQYVLPLSIIGLLIAIYHNLLYYHILPESIAPCTAGVSCTTRLIEIFGFITIPLLSLIAFAIITVAMVCYARLKKSHEK